jgi:hypothetical protein
VLFAICVWLGGPTSEPPRRRAGTALIAAGLVLELVGLVLRAWTVEWLGFPVAVTGAALCLGCPSWRVAVLMFGLVPVPTTVESLRTPVPETMLLSGACAFWRAAGVAFSCAGPVARLGTRNLGLISRDVGWTLAWLLAQLGWFRAVMRGATCPIALRSAIAWAAAALVVQPLAIAVALGLFATGSESLARAWLSSGLWLTCAAGAMLSLLRPRS